MVIMSWIKTTGGFEILWPGKRNGGRKFLDDDMSWVEIDWQPDEEIDREKIFQRSYSNEAMDSGVCALRLAETEFGIATVGDG
ncbi:hypothetical protein C5167_008630 [Papaver somniferum]|uniref:Uncharacterized protein n=1 Tax=Papaver somniferum TaxID=3469 RepID=A0A4Y7JYT7_PAPSO|nr:hypothetical protein C5167_008630 [Papaver somniferum]